MDESRRADLKRIDERLKGPRVKTRLAIDENTDQVYTERITEDHKHYKWAAEQAARARHTILAQRNDKELARLRARLIKAARAGDKRAEVQITAQIRKHEGKSFEDYS